MKKFLITLALVLVIAPEVVFAQKDGKCDLPTNYQEPKPDKKIQSWIKRFGAVTIDDLRKHIALDNDCEEKDVIFLRIVEQKVNGLYSVCVKGKEMKYKRLGNAFMRNDERTLFDVAPSSK
ncbi:hypothetical protein [Chryseobacterium polytrichastri]|uniref:Beta/Gamma crystallin n=1 Tax=Chryseobacterium polytrichastri TaxID=1302687 RepID=A0A1M6TAZ1_9FLAO|nr:hypothetical protein [Chryseobacterium polytrichastri]SHK54155.1 hypothetical protein SAMN05444267_100538 [Chryseobacterium polytrichastri]